MSQHTGSQNETFDVNVSKLQIYQFPNKLVNTESICVLGVFKCQMDGTNSNQKAFFFCLFF